MRLLKAQNTNPRTINGRGVPLDVNDSKCLWSQQT